MRSGRKGREERSVLQTAVFVAQGCVYHVILKLILWLLQFLTQWEFWQSNGHGVAAAQGFDGLLGRLASLGTRPTSDHKNKKRTKCPLLFHRRRWCVMAFALFFLEFFLAVVVLGRCLEENKGLHMLSDRMESKKKKKRAGKWILTRLQETQTETKVLNPPPEPPLQVQDSIVAVVMVMVYTWLCDPFAA